MLTIKPRPITRINLLNTVHGSIRTYKYAQIPSILAIVAIIPPRLNQQHTEETEKLYA